MSTQRGGFVMGMVAGLLIGLALALGVALYITKAPIPFINKVPQRTAAQDTAETERNKTWDPNAPLGGKTGVRAPGAAASDAGGAPTSPASLPPGIQVPPPRDPAAILSGQAPANSVAPAAKPVATPPARQAPAAANGVDPFVYFVQTGAYTRNEDAEQQRARLALAGQSAKITEREQAGRTVYRVRLGPMQTRGEADGVQVRLQEQSIEGQIVRVERP